MTVWEPRKCSTEETPLTVVTERRVKENSCTLSGPLAPIKSLSSAPMGKPILKSIPHMKEKGASARVSRTRTMVVDFSKVKADLFSDTSGQVSIEQVSLMVR